MTSANHAILLHSDDTALLIAKFLAAKDMICLRSVSRGLYNVLTNNEELIFKEYIKRDFVEGEILLTIDKCWEEETGGFVNPSMDHLAINLDNSDPVQMMNESHHLTFHAIDVELYQAITVFNRTRFTDGEDGEEVFFEVDRHSTGSPRMYGLPPVGSPYFRILSDEELDQLDSDIDDSRGGGEIEGVMIDHNIDYMFLTGGIYGLRKDRRINFEELSFGFTDYFSAETIYYPHDVCNFMRALMKENCLTGGILPRQQEDDVVLQQPTWMCTANILDNIVSYASFEDQTGNLRLVCCQFEASAMKLLEHKLLDQVNEIGRYEAEYRLAPVKSKVTVGSVFCHVPTFDENRENNLSVRHHDRRLKIYRFYSAAGEPIELVLQSTFVACHDDYLSKCFDQCWRN